MASQPKAEGDPEPESLAAQEDVQILIDALRSGSHVVVYTGAGISTAADIPDYRGPNGVYTRMAKGLTVSPCELTAATPTLSHMVLVALLNAGRVQHIVSQNCDGLHRRSGVPQDRLSEIHGNMYIEVCDSCSPPVEYVRDFDVTGRTARHRHVTDRACTACSASLRDTIILPGESGKLAWPLNWTAALDHAARASHIIVLGSSLKVLRHYKTLWCMNRVKSKRPSIIIVNLERTSKDTQAVVRIPRSCDDVMQQVAVQLGLDVPVYTRESDSLFRTAADSLTGEVQDTTATANVREDDSKEKIKAVGPVPVAKSSRKTGSWYLRGVNRKTRPTRAFGKRRRKSTQQESSRLSESVERTVAEKAANSNS